MITHSIYRIVCVATGKVYVGQTINNRLRKHKHFSELKRNTHHSQKLQRAYNKYGKQSFYFEVIENNISHTLIQEREVYWIAYFDSLKNGYNMDEGGRTYPHPRTVECVWNDTHYTCIADASRATGIKENTLRRWLANGLSADSDTAHFKKAIPIEWNGVKYSSLAHVARAKGIDRKLVEYYVAQGWYCDADVKPRKKPCIWNNIQYSSIRAAAKVCGITDGAMIQRLRKGFTCDRDMER